MKTIAIISQKGGVGKSNFAVHLATAATRAGIETVILDSDQQATASAWSRWRKGADPEVIDCAAPTLLPHKVVKAEENGNGLCVIDTPPHAESMAVAAARCADLILIPCAPQAFDLEAIQVTADLVKTSRKPAYVIFTKGPHNAPNIYKAAELLVSKYGLDVAPHMMPLRAAYNHAVGEGLTAMESEPGSKAAEEFEALYRWASQLAGLMDGRSAKKPASRKGKAA